VNRPSDGLLQAREQALVFELARQPYALPLLRVREVLPLATLIQVPEAPRAFAGILRLRGSLLPVVDLRDRLGLLRSAPELGQCILVLTGTAPVGLLVDAVRGLLPLHGLPESPADPAQCRLVRRTFETHEGVVLLLEADAILDADVRAFLSEALPGPDERPPEPIRATGTELRR
jgi:purine-binding chemotaxis protein CheW